MLTAGIPEPPSHIASLMEKTQVFIVKTEMDFAHRFAHTDASRIVERNKGRIASVEEEMGTWGIDYDYLIETKERTAKLGAITGKADRVRVTSAKGDGRFILYQEPIGARDSTPKSSRRRHVTASTVG
ncbi:MAG TPA: hypothetical protein VFF30_17255 [Nitrososphaerales archaeon]|nr:hypothetical protein [Nitrososphaerales archaeon]